MATSELLSVRVEAELAERVKTEAVRDRRTVSAFIRNLIADTLSARTSGPREGTAS